MSATTLTLLNVANLQREQTTFRESVVESNLCPASDQENVLQQGYRYSYKFSSEAHGEAVGTTNDRGRMMIDCIVHLEHSHNCYFELQLQGCTLNADGGTPGSELPWLKNKPLPDLSRHPLMFSLVQGEVKTIYRHPDDPLYVLNIKRGALSAFVFKLSSVSGENHEMHTDVHGTCPYQSSPIKGLDGGVKTSKNMLYCSYPSRPDWQFSPWSIFWNMTFIQYQINSTTKCEYKINVSEKRIEKVYCKERHAIGLESTHRTTTGVQTNIYYHIIHLNSEKVPEGASRELPSVETGIQYEYDHTPVPDPQSEPPNFISVASEMLSDMVEASQEEIRLFTIPQFTDFVGWLRTSYDLVPFIQEVKSCSFLRKHLVCTDIIKDLAMAYLSDALIQCNSVPCVKAFSELAVNNDVSQIYENFALYSWSNMHFVKPEIVEYIKDICMAKQTQFCWLSLGTVIQNYHKRTFPVYNETSKEVDNVVDYFYVNLGLFCGGPTMEIGTFPEGIENRQLTFLKAIGNTADAYLTYAPGGLRQILKCFAKEELSQFVKKAAFETLHKIDACRDEVLCRVLYKKLGPMLLNSSVDADMRINAYRVLMRTPEEFKLETDLIKLFQNEKNSQLLSYISSDLLGLLADNEYRSNHPEFISKLGKLLDTEGIILESYVSTEEGMSHSKRYGQFSKFHFLPEEMQGFGEKFDISVIYSFYNMLPKSLTTNITVQLFNKVINLFESGVNFEGVQSLGLMVQKALEQMNAKELTGEKISNILRDLVLILKQSDSSDEQERPFFDENIINNIKKIVEAYHEHKDTSRPFFSFYINMLGSTLSSWTSDDFRQTDTIMAYVHKLMRNLKDGIVYNNTRVVRVIEAYHQVPTLMGLPLNWTTNATLAFSMRRGVKLAYSQDYEGLTELSADGFFQPSAALTFLNRMVLDFPTYTQIGVQANSSGYTSTQFKGHIVYSKENKLWKVKIDTPEKSQKILELFRTNQLIKHDRYEEIPDWDIERTSASWCLGDEYSLAFGFQLCHERSYPNVTHLIKPWALMAGWCKWRLTLDPYDSEMKSLNFELEQKSDHNDRTIFQARFKAPGSSKKREANFDFMYDATSGEADMNLKVPEIPEIGFVGQRKQILENDALIGLRSTYTVSLSKGFQYQVIYAREDKKEKLKEETTSKNKSPKEKELLTVIQERLLKLATPFNEYTWVRKMHSQKGNTKADVHISYKNQAQQMNWLLSILPLTFWEESNRAWIRMQFSQKSISQKLQDAVTYHLTGHATTPHASVDLVYSILTMPGRQQTNLNLTSTETSSGKLNSFVNFTHDLWISDTDKSNVKQIRVINLTIPKKSWNLSSQRIIEGGDVKYDIVLSRAVMVPKDPSDDYAQDYVGWWSPDLESAFDLQKRELKLKADISTRILTAEQLAQEVKSINQVDVSGLANKHIKADIGFYYPVNSVEQVLSFDGFFVVSGSNTVFRFQKDFVLYSSYNNMRLTSHSIYRTEGLEMKQLSHNSFLTHSTTDTKAFYNLDYRQIVNEVGCVEIDFNHNITSHVYNMQSGVTYHCNSDNEKQHVLRLTFESNSSYWDMLSMHIKQIIEDVSLERSQEMMNFVHPLLYINVSAQWYGKEHTKVAEFIKRPENIVLFTVKVRASHPGQNEIQLDIHDSEAAKYIYQRKLFDDFKQVKVRLLYPDHKHEAVSLHGRITDPHHRIWTVILHPQILNIVQSFSNLMDRLSHAFEAVAKDPGHPINQMLKPALKMPLAEYIASLKETVVNGFWLSWQAVKDTLFTLRPFYSSSLGIVTNTANAAFLQVRKLYSVLERKSITIWAIKYFELPSLLHEGLMNIKEGLAMFRDIWLHVHETPLSENSPEITPVRKFVIETGRIFDWNSFNQMPSLAIERIKNNLFPWLQVSDTEVKPHHAQETRSKLAMIFGPRHVYTFDSYVYEFPEYPSRDCAYLLAHDVHKSLFSVFTTKDSINVLFPEMGVSINSRMEVYINGSKDQSSLPIQSKNEKVAVRREGNILFVWSPVLTVACEGQNNLCTLEISGWSGGGTVGLLGNADGESYNDYMLPDGQIASDVAEFAKAYELSGKPVCRDLKNPREPVSTPEQRKQCSEDLKNACSFYSGIRKLFMEPCVTDMISEGNDCSTLSALSSLCYHKKQSMEIHCKVKQPESRNIRHKLEVVLLVNEQQSMLPERKTKFLKGIESILNALDLQFESSGYSNIVYSLVGFGGSGVHYHPSAHTVDNNIWVPLKPAVNELLKNIEFGGTERFSPVEAIRYAAEVLGHDTFDTKIFIIIADTDIQEAESEAIYLVQQHLSKNHITLFAFGNYSGIERGKKVFGVRSDGLMFPASKKGDAYLDYPRGDVAKLVSGTRGSLFLKKFVDSNNPAAFFTEFAQEVWAKVRKEVEFCRNCKTVRSGWWYYHNECHIIDC